MVTQAIRDRLQKRWYENQARWREKGLEPGIVSAVNAFNMLGMPTVSSCEGHAAGESEQRPCPHIVLSATAAPDLRRDHVLISRIEANIEAVARHAVQEFTEHEYGKRRIYIGDPRRLPQRERELWYETIQKCRLLLPGYVTHLHQFQLQVLERNCEYQQLMSRVRSEHWERFSDKRFTFNMRTRGQYLVFEPRWRSGRRIVRQGVKELDDEILLPTRTFLTRIVAAMEIYYIDHSWELKPILLPAKQKVGHE